MEMLSRIRGLSSRTRVHRRDHVSILSPGVGKKCQSALLLGLRQVSVGYKAACISGALRGRISTSRKELPAGFCVWL